MKIYDLLWKKSEDEKTGKARWEKVGVLLEKDDGKKSIKHDLVPAGNWEGWLPKDDLFTKEPENEIEP